MRFYLSNSESFRFEIENRRGGVCSTAREGVDRHMSRVGYADLEMEYMVDRVMNPLTPNKSNRFLRALTFQLNG